MDSKQNEDAGTPGMRTPGLPEGYDARAEAHRLLRTVRAGALATRGLDGFPFASLVNVATAMDGSPVLLLSGLSAHTQNLMAAPEASILLSQAGKGDPLAHPRLTVTGRIAAVADEAACERLKTRFLARHPKSAMYADFGDFGFFRMTVVRGHLNGGFARAAQFEPFALLTSLEGAEELEAIEAEALGHMNADHAEAVQLYATALLGQKQGRWRALALDPEGIDLGLGDLTARLAFPRPVRTGGELRRMLGELAAEARRTGSP